MIDLEFYIEENSATSQPSRVYLTFPIPNDCYLPHKIILNSNQGLFITIPPIMEVFDAHDHSGTTMIYILRRQAFILDSDLTVLRDNMLVIL